jgi:hypothetical protein
VATFFESFCGNASTSTIRSIVDMPIPIQSILYYRIHIYDKFYVNIHFFNLFLDNCLILARKEDQSQSKFLIFRYWAGNFSILRQPHSSLFLYPLLLLGLRDPLQWHSNCTSTERLNITRFGKGFFMTHFYFDSQTSFSSSPGFYAHISSPFLHLFQSRTVLNVDILTHRRITCSV